MNGAGQSQKPLLRVTGLKKYYELQKGAGSGKARMLKAVDDISFSVGRGFVFGLVGESGSGKTTVGKCLLGIEEPTSGEIVYCDDSMSKQMVFQNPYTSFNPALTLGSSLREIGHVFKLDKQETGARIARLLEQVSLPPDVLNRKPKELSGGQLQRLAIARALLTSPEFVVADEPVSALDVSVQAQIINLFEDLKEEYGLTILFISHDLTIIEHICDTVAVVYLGRIVETATAKEIFANPQHPYTRALLASRPKNAPDDDDTEREAPLSGTANAVEIPSGCRFWPRCPERCGSICEAIDPVPVDVQDGHIVACHLLRQQSDSEQKISVTDLTDLTEEYTI